MARIHDNILSTIGGTPIVRLEKLEKPGVKLFAKVEAFNPGGSVKDRLALGIIEAAEKSGALKPGMTVVEATSGNTGIGLAVVCAQKGYPLVITMAESFSVERRRLMRFLGAKVVLTPAALKGTGMVDKARELAETHGWFLARQFENEANPAMHERTTAREIVEAFEGQSLDYFVTGYGTGGTLTGVGRVLRKESPKTKIIACEPDVAALISSGTPQARRDDGAPAESHPAFHPHPMQGWTPDFIPKITSEAIDGKYFDEMVLINGADAIAASKALAQQEGIFVGITSGATLAGALKTSESAPKGSNVLCMLPDTGERYLSTPLFEGVEADMNDEENEISRSTPTAQFTSASATPKPSGDATAKAEKAAPPVDGDAKAFLDRTINDRSQPVVMFALEWCEFCWAARKLFSALGVDYRSVDLDSVAYQADDLGNRIRAALKAKTGVATIPQIFVGGEFVGGCSELLEAKASGQLSELLTKAGASFDPGNEVDPFDLLPKWVHPRTTEASTGAEQKPH